jgi:hypothetical protein
MILTEPVINGITSGMLLDPSELQCLPASHREKYILRDNKISSTGPKIRAVRKQNYEYGSE